MGDVHDKFLRTLKPFFDDPKMAEGVSKAEFYLGVAESLAGYSDQVLELAAEKIKEGHKYRTFPQVADCITACKAARDELYGKTIANAPPKEAYPEWTKERQEWANKALCGSRGLRYAEPAAEEGWVLALWDFIREKGRLPNDDEARDIRRKYNNREKWFEENGVGMWTEMRTKMNIRKLDLANLVKMALHANHR
jgi:hypothetical protein